MKCYCDLDLPFATCCEPYLSATQVAPNAVSLMRSRYSAFATGNRHYLLQSWHQDFRPKSLNLDSDQHWIGLKIVDHETSGESAWVKFIARYKVHGKAYRLEEHSLFSCVAGRWYYLHPNTPNGQE